MGRASMSGSDQPSAFDQCRWVLLRDPNLSGAKDPRDYVLEEIDYWHRIGEIDDETHWHLDRWVRQRWPLTTSGSTGTVVGALEQALAQPASAKPQRQVRKQA